MDKPNYGFLKVEELKRELKNRGARVSGTKSQLIQRLKDYDRNNNFCSRGEENNILPKLIYYIEWPKDCDYHSVTHSTSIPDIDIVHINTYFLESYKDNVGLTEYAAVHRKGYNMLINKYLIALVSATSDQHLFFRGQVQSENTKSLSYFVSVAFSESGSILQSVCECVAGKGPQAVCKHVCVICYAILKFKELCYWHIRQTPTQIKQKWHEPKRKNLHLSPKKAHDVSFEIQEYNVSKKKRRSLCYDPRPINKKNEGCSSDSIKSKIINYCSLKKKRLGFNGIFEIASMGALVNDHSYLDKPLHYQIILNKIKVSPEQANTIEKLTRSQNRSKIWHEERALRVTASHVGEICKFNDKKDKIKYAEGLVFPKTLKNEAVQWGQSKENVAIQCYEAMSGKVVTHSGLIISCEHPFIGASPDGIIDKDKILEVKCPFSIKNNLITPKNYPHIFINNNELNLKENSNYFYQIQTQLLVSRKSVCDFFIWTNCDEKNIVVHRNDNIINNIIIPKITEFYFTYMLPLIAKKFYDIN